MMAGLNKTRTGIGAMLFMAVILLAFSAGAATIPSVSTLNPLEKGLQTPLRMVLDQNGDIYVADPRSGGIVVLDQYGVDKQVVQAGGSVGAVALLNPLTSNIPDGKLLVSLGNQVAVYNQAGVEVAKLGSGVGQFVKAAGITLDASGRIYVTDAGSYNVKIFDTAGNYTGSFGVYGSAATPGAFVQPSALAVVTVSGVERLAVVDSYNCNVQFFTLSGAYLRTVGTAGSVGPLLFSTPVGVAFDTDRMYVLDSYQGNIQAVDMSVDPPSFLSNIGSYGFGAGQLLTPTDLVYDRVNRRLLVSNGMSNLVSFGIDGGSNPGNTTPPVLTVDQSALSVDLPTAILSGTVDAGATLTASVDTAAQASVAAFPSPTTWTLSLSGLVAGQNTVSITAKNQYDVTTTRTAVITYTPAVVQLGIGPYPELTGLAVVTLTGTTEIGAAVTIVNAATNISGQAVVTGTDWVYDVALIEGPNALSITSTKNGASPAGKNIGINLDSLAPVITASLLSDGSTAANQVLSVSGSVSDQNPGTFTVNGTPVALTNGQFNTALTLNIGANIITLTAVDQLGNAASDVRTIYFTPALPTITVLSPVDGLYTNVLDVLVSLLATEAVAVTVNGQAALPGSTAGEFSSTVRLASGITTIIIDATDAFNRTVQEKRTIVYDNNAPMVVITSPAQDIATNTPGLTIMGSVGDDTAVKSIRATINGGDVPLALVNSDYTLFAEFTQETAYSVVVTVTDMADNSAVAMRTVLYDVTAPVLSVDPVIMSRPVSLNGTVEAGATVVVTDATGAAGAVVMNGAQWSANLSGGTLDSATLMVKASDAAGNVSMVRVNVPVPDGDVDGDGRVTMSDFNRVMEIVTYGIQPTAYELAHGDLGPLLNGKINPNGILDKIDAVLIRDIAKGKATWL